MLGSIDTGGFSKSQVDAMRDSNYFNRTGVEGVYGPKDKKAPIISGTPELDEKFKNNPKGFFGDSKGFLSKQMDNYKSYLDATKDDKSESDKDRDLIRDLANKQEMKFGDMTKGFSSEVAKGLNIYQPPSPNQQMFIPGQQGGKSFGQRLAGAAVGLGKGLMTGVPHGGAFGAVSGFFG